jgi:hypothetical protein
MPLMSMYPDSALNAILRMRAAGLWV